ncbi:hypothetical protein [Noviherbaspirillum massiliense]|uniref:hypothetical protein n=1 Tax=Noviherbaspirillum massiliense TaxID=1465823 RepID=UPI00030E80A0|nr:hypothetical protein [Noviherbaspirillum massiliense]
MPSRALQIIALTLTALGLAPGAAHLMEMPVKLAYPPAMYASVTSTLYAWFGLVGGPVQVAAALSVAVLALQARRLSASRLATASAAALLASLLLWGLIVAPVNAAWANAAGSDPAEFAAAYEQLRLRWEYGHAAAFIAWLAGWFALVAAITRPLDSGRNTAA